MSKVTRMPNKSPPAVSKTYIGGKLKSYPAPRGGGFTTMKLSPDTPANTNRSRAAREAAIRAKYPPLPEKIISGKYAYGPKPPSTALKINKAVKSAAKGIARGAMRAAGPAGALVSMTTPAGTGSDKPKGPLMSGSKSRGPGGGSLSAPNRTAPSRSGGASNSKGPAGPLGANSGPSRSGGASNSKGPAGPLGANSGPSRSTTSSKGPSRGPTSAPSRTAPSKANLGTSRF